jgi:hypothetical protein
MARTNDDLDAVRTIADVLKPFDPVLQRRILRWAAEKLNLPWPVAGEAASASSERALPAVVAGARPGSAASTWLGPGLKAFVAAKRPRNDTEFAATAAYYAQRAAPAAARAAGIRANDLVAAFAATGRRQAPVPGQTLRNARSAGVLASKVPGIFSISRAGEHLVTKTLPRDDAATKTRASHPQPASRPRKPRAQRRKAARRR